MLAQGASFTFRGAAYSVTSVTVEGPTPEVTNATGIGDLAGAVVMVPTGGRTSPGSISIEAIGFVDPISLVGLKGQAAFASPAGSISRNAICESASVEAATGELLRVRMVFTATDYYGS